MTTAVLRPSARRGPTILKRPRFHEAKVPASHTKPVPVLLRNLRLRYARRRPSMSISNKAPTAESSSTDDRKVQFYPKVRVKRIPSRFAYSEEDRVSLWVPKKELKHMIIRNQAEFQYEEETYQDWQKAPEEDDFRQRNGKLVHPFYVWVEQEAAASDSDASAETQDVAGGSDDL